MKKKFIGILLSVVVLTVGIIMSLDREDVIEQEQVSEVLVEPIEGIVEAEFVSWDSFVNSNGESCEIVLKGNFDDDENVHVTVETNDGEMVFDIGNAYDFSIHRTNINTNEALFFFTGIVKEGKNMTHIVRCNGEAFELKGVFNHALDRFYSDGENVYFYSDGEDQGVIDESKIELKYAYNMSDTLTREVTDEEVLGILHRYEEAY